VFDHWPNPANSLTSPEVRCSLLFDRSLLNAMPEASFLSIFKESFHIDRFCCGVKNRSESQRQKFPPSPPQSPMDDFPLQATPKELIFQVSLLIIRRNPYLYLTRVTAQSRPNKRFCLPRIGKLACGFSAISVPLQVFSKIYPPAMQFGSLRSANRPIVRLFPAHNRTHKKDSRERVYVKT
jgi:hypothetical protein